MSYTNLIDNLKDKLTEDSVSKLFLQAKTNHQGSEFMFLLASFHQNLMYLVTHSDRGLCTKIQEINALLRQNYAEIGWLDTEVMSRHTEDLLSSVELKIGDSDPAFLLRTLFVERDTRQASDLYEHSLCVFLMDHSLTINLACAVKGNILDD